MARRSPNSNRPVRPTSTPARRKGIPLSPLAQRMVQDLNLAGLQERTHEAYLRAVRKFAQWLGKSPHLASENDLRRYLLFGPLYHCEACGRDHAVRQSCGNRHCPQCQGHKARQWLEKQLAKMLPCAYFLITFTVPQELRRFVREHRSILANAIRAMFEAAAATLRELAANPKYVGSRKLGFTGVLHTWGRDMNYHLCTGWRSATGGW